MQQKCLTLEQRTRKPRGERFSLCGECFLIFRGQNIGLDAKAVLQLIDNTATRATNTRNGGSEQPVTTHKTIIIIIIVFISFACVCACVLRILGSTKSYETYVPRAPNFHVTRSSLLLLLLFFLCCFVGSVLSNVFCVPFLFTFCIIFFTRLKFETYSA